MTFVVGLAAVVVVPATGLAPVVWLVETVRPLLVVLAVFGEHAAVIVPLLATL